MFWFGKPKSPITQEDENWIMLSYQWFEKTFEVNLAEQEIYLPVKKFLGFSYQGTEDDVLQLVSIIAGKMSIDPGSIEVYFFEEFQSIKFSDEAIYTKYEEGAKIIDGEYSKVIDGLYQIGIERSQLKNPLKLIATIAHELTHIKLLGEDKLEDNDEQLTDLSACLFGFVIFLANNAISKMETWQGNSHNGWEIGGAAGYLHYKVYAFLIAYWMLQRNEKEPQWLSFLDKEILGEVKRSLKYLESKNK